MACGGAACAALVMAACGSGSPVPTSPSATVLSTLGALTERGAAITIPGLPAIPTTLKASAPVAQTPALDSIFRNRTVQLVVESPVFTHRPEVALEITFELWSISGATPTRVYTTTVSTGQPQTSVTIPPATLEDRHAYAWRSFASLDGATGPSSTPFAFRTEFIVIEPPTLRYPIGGETATDRQPPLLVDNGAVLGEAGTVVYKFELDTDENFSKPVRLEAVRMGNTGDRTTGILPDELPSLTMFYWRVRGTNGTVFGEWSVTEAFRTPETADQINPSQITWLHTNVSNWNMSSLVTNVTITPTQVCVFHTAAGQWPISTEVFSDGAPIEGNIWIFGFINDRWYGATWDWLRPGQQCKSVTADEFGAEQIRIPPLDGSWVPRAGDTVGFMMSTIARFGSLAGEERSNIVLVTWPY